MKQHNIQFYNFLNYNYEKYLDEINYDLNESLISNNEYKSYFKFHYVHPYKIRDNYTYQNYQKTIYETLTTHNPDIFEKKLFDKFLTIADILLDNNEQVKDCLYVYLYNLDELNDIKKFCQLYGYYIVDNPYKEGSKYVLIIEATYGYTCKNNEVYNENNGILYHITSVSHVKKIMKIGLIPKHLDKRVSHPGRIYFSLNDNIQELYKLGRQLYPRKRFMILKIDLNKMPYKVKPKFYLDPAYMQYGVFTCENISPDCISLLNENYY